jgi:hypothetical protein
MRPFAQLEHDLNIRGFFKKKTEEELYAEAYKIDGTAQLLLELVISGQPMTREDYNHCIVPTYGPTGSGKSTFVQKEASFLRRVIFKENEVLNKVHSTWSPLQTISRLRYGEVKDLDTFYQDEHRKGRVGQGSATNDWLLQQAEETLRANGNSFFFCSPSPREHIPHWVQETIGFNVDSGFNSAYILGPRFHKPICVAHLGPAFTIDPTILEDYVSAKKAYNKALKKGGGWSAEIDPEIEQFSYDEVMEKVSVGMSRSEVEHIYNQLGLFPGYYMNRVVGRVTSELRKLEREQKAELRKQRQEDLRRIEKEQKDMYEDVANSIIHYFDELGIVKRPMLGAIKHEARTRGIIKDSMSTFTDYFLARWTVKEAMAPTAKGQASADPTSLVAQGHRAEKKGKNEEIRWQHKFNIDSKLILKVTPNNGRRAPPGKPDLQVWTADRGLWLMAVKYRQDYHNAWIPYFLKSGKDKPCPEFRIAQTIVGGAEAAGAELQIIEKPNFYGVKIKKNGAKEDWIPDYVVVPFCGQIAGNEFFEPVNYLNPTTRGFQLEDFDDFQPLDTPATSYIRMVQERLSPPKGKRPKKA